MEKIQIRCEHCSAVLAVPESAAGKKIRCPKCQGVVFVTALEKDLREPSSQTENKKNDRS